MENKHKINVFSEIGRLRSVLVHRPGQELENLTPDLLNRLLFDDTPYLKVADKEHDAFTNLLRSHGVEVLYIEELVAETLSDNPKLIEPFVDQFIREGNVNPKYREKFKKFLMKKNHLDMVKWMIAGTQISDLNIKEKSKTLFVADPLPNILFQRDPFAAIGHGATINHMWAKTRNRETIFPNLVLKHNKRFSGTPIYYERNWKKGRIEGGDIMVLNSTTLIMGVSQRTDMMGINLAAKQIFKNSNKYRRIIAIDLPKNRAFMHLDTVFTNTDYDKFIVHPLIFENISKFKLYEITPSNTKEGIQKRKIDKSFLQLLESELGHKVKLIKCGGDNAIASARDQWNDGTNVLTISPGEVIAYDRNVVTNQILRDSGLKVHLIPSSEMSRGRGGPRCMTMPIWRDNLTHK